MLSLSPGFSGSTGLFSSPLITKSTTCVSGSFSTSPTVTVVLYDIAFFTSPLLASSLTLKLIVKISVAFLIPSLKSITITESLSVVGCELNPTNTEVFGISSGFLSVKFSTFKVSSPILTLLSLSFFMLS